MQQGDSRTAGARRCPQPPPVPSGMHPSLPPAGWPVSPQCSVSAPAPPARPAPLPCSCRCWPSSDGTQWPAGLEACTCGGAGCSVLLSRADAGAMRGVWPGGRVWCSLRAGRREVTAARCQQARILQSQTITQASARSRTGDPGNASTLGQLSSRRQEAELQLHSLGWVAQAPQEQVACEAAGQDQQQRMVQRVPHVAARNRCREVQPSTHHAMP